MYYPIQLDKTRNFKFGMRAISLIEIHFKKPIHKIDQENLTVEELAVFLWAGLQHEDEKLTPSKVIDLVDEYSDMVTVFKAMSDAQQLSFSGGEESGTDEAEKNA